MKWSSNIIKENKKLSFKGNIIDEKEDGGKYTSYYKNGQIEEERNFKNGKEDGLVTEWSEDGKVTSKRNFINGNFISSRLCTCSAKKRPTILQQVARMDHKLE